MPTAHGARADGAPGAAMQPPPGDAATSPAPADWLFLVEAARAMRLGVPIRDRSHGFRIHACCFSGTEAIDWLRTSPFVATRTHEDAAWLAGRLLRAGFFNQVAALGAPTGAAARSSAGAAVAGPRTAKGMAGHLRLGLPGRSRVHYRSSALYRFALDADVHERRFWSGAVAVGTAVPAAAGVASPAPAAAAAAAAANLRGYGGSPMLLPAAAATPSLSSRSSLSSPSLLALGGAVGAAGPPAPPPTSGGPPSADPLAFRIQPRVAANSALLTLRIADAVNALLRALAAEAAGTVRPGAHAAATTSAAAASELAAAPSGSHAATRLALQRALLRLLRHTRSRFRALAQSGQWQRYHAVGGGADGGDAAPAAAAERDDRQQPTSPPPPTAPAAQSVPYSCTREWLPLSAGASHSLLPQGSSSGGRDHINGGISIARLDDEGVYPTFRTLGFVAAPPDAVLAALLDTTRRSEWDTLLCGGGVRQLGVLDVGVCPASGEPSLFRRLSAVPPPRSAPRRQHAAASGASGAQPPSLHTAPAPAAALGAAAAPAHPALAGGNVDVGKNGSQSHASRSDGDATAFPLSRGAPGAASIVADYFSPRPLMSSGGHSSSTSGGATPLAAVSTAPSPAVSVSALVAPLTLLSSMQTRPLGASNRSTPTAAPSLSSSSSARASPAAGAPALVDSRPRSPAAPKAPLAMLPPPALSRDGAAAPSVAGSRDALSSTLRVDTSAPPSAALVRPGAMRALPSDSGTRNDDRKAAITSAAVQQPPSAFDALAAALLPASACASPPPRLLHCVGRSLTPLVVPRDTVVLQDVGLWPDGSIAVYEVSVQAREAPPSRSSQRCDCLVDGYLLTPVEVAGTAAASSFTTSSSSPASAAGGRSSSRAGPPAPLPALTRVTHISQLTHGRHMPLWLGNALLGLQTHGALARLRLAVLGHGLAGGKSLPGPRDSPGGLLPLLLGGGGLRRRPGVTSRRSPFSLQLLRKQAGLVVGAGGAESAGAESGSLPARAKGALTDEESPETQEEHVTNSVADDLAVLPSRHGGINLSLIFREQPTGIGRIGSSSAEAALLQSLPQRQQLALAALSSSSIVPRLSAQAAALESSASPSTAPDGSGLTSLALPPQEQQQQQQQQQSPPMSYVQRRHTRRSVIAPSLGLTAQLRASSLLPPLDASAVDTSGGSAPADAPVRRASQQPSSSHAQQSPHRGSVARHLTAASFLSEEFDYEAHGYIIGGPVSAVDDGHGDSGDPRRAASYYEDDDGGALDEDGVEEDAERGGDNGSAETDFADGLGGAFHGDGGGRATDEPGGPASRGRALEGPAHDVPPGGGGTCVDDYDDYSHFFSDVPADAATAPSSPMPPSPSPPTASAAAPLNTKELLWAVDAATVPAAMTASASRALRDDGYAHVRSPVGVRDFELLTVLGQGAYGTVLQVRRVAASPPPHGDGDAPPADDVGAVFAMKVLRKRDLVTRGQVGRTLTERRILTLMAAGGGGGGVAGGGGAAGCPFIVGLKYAFQSRSHLVSARPPP